jgi:imidazole glycerol-phosphate synthase subunit HisF
MLKRRLIPILYLKDGWMVRSEAFSIHQVIGNPVHHVERMVQWDVDELIVINISESEGVFDFSRDDYRHRGPRSLAEFITMIATECRIPLTFGGLIRNFEDIRNRIQNGADKVTINTGLLENPRIVSEAAEAFGCQAVVASIDYRIEEGVAQVYAGRGRVRTGAALADWASRAADLGAGEILINAIDRDGKANGYDIENIAMVSDLLEVPVIACGGAGHVSHFLRCFNETGASAVAAGNIFHFTENAYPRSKAYLRQKRDDLK